ncbi:hypothetical protein QTP88_020815 [Uroleucon formosanum]
MRISRNKTEYMEYEFGGKDQEVDVHDEAPAHNAHIIRDHLNQVYERKWFGTYGPIEWPARPLDITPLDFFMGTFENNSLRRFTKKYTLKEIPNQTTLRKGYVNDIYEDTLVKIRSFIFELEKSNHITIAKLFDNSMHILWPKGVRHDDILLFLSDTAPYTVNAGKSLNIFYTKMVHVTCIVHAFHRIAEQIRGHYSKVDKIIANVKKVFCKSPYGINCFKEKAPLLSIPPQPIITRWGTWLKAAIYYCDIYELIRDIITSFDEKDSVGVENSQKYLSDPDVASNLIYIKSNFGFLPDVPNHSP